MLLPMEEGTHLQWRECWLDMNPLICSNEQTRRFRGSKLIVERQEKEEKRRNEYKKDNPHIPTRDNPGSDFGRK
jgi:hypothetical protein